jgi:hypothetical protein
MGARGSTAQTGEKMLVVDVKIDLANLTRDFNIIKSNATEYEYHFTPKGCTCGGTAGLGFGFPSYNLALWEALQEAKRISAQGFHYHGGTKKHRNK